MNELLMAGVSRWIGGALTGLYQGLLVAAAAWVVLRVLKRSNAATRHAVAFAALLGVAGLPVVQAFRALQERDGSAVANAAAAATLTQDYGTAWGVEDGDFPRLASGEARPDTAVWDAKSYTPGEGMDSFSVVRRDEDVHRSAMDPGGHDGHEHVVDPDAAMTQADVAPVSSLALDASTASRPSVGIARFRDGWVDLRMRMRALLTRLEGWDWSVRLPLWAVLTLMTLWGGLGGWRLVQLFRQYAVLRRLRREAAPASEAMQSEFRRIACEFGVPSSTALGIAPGLSSPILAGCRRPTVLVPASFEQGEAAAWTPVFLHELAHVRRGDVWSNLLQQTLAALYFFHPGVTWLSRRLSAEREIACDDHVLAAQGAPRAYALFLTEHARRMQGPDWVAAPAAWSNPSQLKERIHMLLDTQRNASPRLARMRAGAWTTSVLLVALLAFHAGPRVSVAGSAEKTIELAVKPGEPMDPSTATVVESVEVEGTIPEPSGDVLTEVQVDTEVDARPKVKVKVGEVRLTGPGGDVLVVAPTPARIELTPGKPGGPAAMPLPTPAAAPLYHAIPPHPPGAVVVMPSVPPAPASTVRPGRVVARLDESKAPHAEGSSDSLERRLDRLERLVESLVGERGNKTKDATTFYWKSDKNPELLGWNAKNANELRERVREIEVRARVQADDLRKRVEEQVHREGQQDSEKQRQIAEKAMRDALRDADKVQREAVQAAEKALAKLREESKPERRADLRRPLEEHRRALEREMRRMETQLEQLEAQLEKLDEASERMDETREDVFDRSKPRQERRTEERVIEDRREELPPAKKKEKAQDAAGTPSDPNATADSLEPVRR